MPGSSQYFMPLTLKLSHACKIATYESGKYLLLEVFFIQKTYFSRQLRKFSTDTVRK
jgi:hypothetical protein